ncbi:MAG: hypothetical protein Q7S01_04955 [bacterium]|nr:hypothetical protein [bacterium]
MASPDSLNPTGIKIMPEPALLKLKDGVARGRDERLVIGGGMTLKKLEPYLAGMGLLDEELFEQFRAFPAFQGVNEFPGVKDNGPEIKEEKCKVCESLGINGFIQKGGEGSNKLVVMSQGFMVDRNTNNNRLVRYFLNRAGIDVLNFDYFEDGKAVDVSFQKRIGDLTNIIRGYSKKYSKIGGYGASVGGSALWVAASLLKKERIELSAIANRTIIPDLLTGLANRLNLTPQFITAHVEQVCKIVNESMQGGRVKVSPKELEEMVSGKFDLNKYEVGCSMLDIHGSGDTIAGMKTVRNAMNRARQFNPKTQLIEIAGVSHDNEPPKDYTMQLYLLTSFLCKHMFEGS